MFIRDVLILPFQYWMVDGNTAANGKTANTNQSFIIDSGTTLIIATPEAAAAFYKGITKSRKCSSSLLSLSFPVLTPLLGVDNDGYYTMPCGAFTTLNFSFEIGGTSFSIPGDYLNLGQVKAGSPWCVSAIAYQE